MPAGMAAVQSADRSRNPIGRDGISQLRWFNYRHEGKQLLYGSVTELAAEMIRDTCIRPSPSSLSSLTSCLRISGLRWACSAATASARVFLLTLFCMLTLFC